MRDGVVGRPVWTGQRLKWGVSPFSRARTGLALLSLLAATGSGLAATPAQGGLPAGSEAPAAAAPAVPGDVERIRRALNRPAPVRLDTGGLRFYVDVVARQRTFADYVKGFDLLNGKTKRGNPMTHRDFENLVTPREFQRLGGLVVGW
jgi:hypothetical protein